ncbi:bL17 family ribosomal protein [Patescibacteria group bacterium]|nr:bL17 family ribosomal protein [Patescibacteria group bacterium]
MSKQRLKQKPAHARMLKRNLVTSLLLYESVRTTKRRAKAIQPTIDRLITVAKTRPPHIAIRFINSTVTDKNASRKVMEVYRERYIGRTSGLTRMVPVGERKGDGAELVDLSLVEGVGSSGDRNPESGSRNPVNSEVRIPDSLPDRQAGESRTKKKSLKKKTS